MASLTDLLHRPEASSPGAVLMVLDLGRYLPVPVSTVYKLTRLKHLPGLESGKHWRFSRRDVDAWMSARRGHELTPPAAA